jgi:hypothetical protein
MFADALNLVWQCVKPGGDALNLVETRQWRVSTGYLSQPKFTKIQMNTGLGLESLYWNNGMAKPKCYFPF